jgi:hypothetical protein
MFFDCFFFFFGGGFVGDISLVGECFSEKRKLNFFWGFWLPNLEKKKRKKESPDSKSGSSR